MSNTYHEAKRFYLKHILINEANVKVSKNAKAWIPDADEVLSKDGVDAQADVFLKKVSTNGDDVALLTMEVTLLVGGKKESSVVEATYAYRSGVNSSKVLKISKNDRLNELAYSLRDQVERAVFALYGDYFEEFVEVSVLEDLTRRPRSPWKRSNTRPWMRCVCSRPRVY